jgi:hypothetical protein
MIERGREWGGLRRHGGGLKGDDMDLVAVGEVVGEVPVWT